ncbi:hypothetical protein [Qipengyuania psychrotolerans]|uniref:DUF2892 domain-containing protein n=1 Tax=Qipengyuania psychrotolerans TaxID=2867238 RepID=A0ABX8ZFG3_9SPHN|nr:hypothetical protein [Qipengyuania psychrotolerans]QZD86473.1 hypothetical protein K3166_09490 [Qipengyuania psychrotolerans]
MSEEDIAAKRFWTLQAVRACALAVCFAGILILADLVALPAFVGGILLVLGALEFFFLPWFLVKQWKKLG